MITKKDDPSPGRIVLLIYFNPNNLSVQITICFKLIIILVLYANAGDVCIGSFIPVKEAFNINSLACLKVANSVVKILVIAIEIVLKAELYVGAIL